MSFPIPRPRGKDMPSATPRGSARSKAPMQGLVPEIKALDRNGRRTVGIAPRTTGAIAIEGREQGAASTAKRRALVRAIS